jgi:hypothetical protein
MPNGMPRDAFCGTTTDAHPVGQDDRHHAFVVEVVESVPQ